MRKTLAIILFIAFFIIIGFYIGIKIYAPKIILKKINTEVTLVADSVHLKSGDIIFQTSLSQQSVAIQLATHSEYSPLRYYF